MELSSALQIMFEIWPGPSVMHGPTVQTRVNFPMHRRGSSLCGWPQCCFIIPGLNLFEFTFLFSNQCRSRRSGEKERATWLCCAGGYSDINMCQLHSKLMLAGLKYVWGNWVF